MSSPAIDFHSQIASIMEVLANAAVAEICKVVDDGYAVVHLEMSQSHKENEFLRRKIKLLELQIARYRAERMKGPDGSMNSRFPGVRLLNRHRDTAGPSLQARTRFLNRGPSANQSVTKRQPINLDQDPDQEVVTTTKIESADVDEDSREELLIVKVEGAGETKDTVLETPAEASIGIRGGGEGVMSPPDGLHLNGAHPAGRRSETEAWTGLTGTKTSQTKVESRDREQAESHGKCSPSRTLQRLPETCDTEDTEHPSYSTYPQFQENIPGNSSSAAAAAAALNQNRTALCSSPPSDSTTDNSTDDKHNCKSTCNGVVIDLLSGSMDSGSDVTLSWLQRDDGEVVLQEGGSSAGTATPLGNLGIAKFRSQYRPLPCLQMSGRPNAPGEVILESNRTISNHLFTFNNPPVNPTIAVGTVEHQQEPNLPFRSDVHHIALNANSLPSTNQNQNSQPSTSQNQESGSAEANALQQRHLLPHACVFCARRYAHLCQLRIHERVHTGEKPYQCAQCGKSFGQFCSLKRHQMVHTGEKPYRCTQCGKQFSTSNNLKVHQSVHTGEKRFHCSHCGKNFSFLSNLIRHQAIHASK